MSAQSLMPSKCDDCGVSIRNHGKMFTHKVYGNVKYVCVNCSVNYGEWRLEVEW